MNRTEEYEQSAVIQWAAYAKQMLPELDLLFHIPNGGNRSISEAVRFKKAGVRAGVPDLFLPVPKGDSHGLWIEMKAKGGRIRPEQREWIEKLRQQGYEAYVCYGAEEAINRIKRYLICG